MRAVTWQGRTDMQVTDVPDPRIERVLSRAPER